MKIYTEISLKDFDAWSGARQTMETLEKLSNFAEYADCFGELEVLFEEDMGEDMSETEINDTLWFESDWIAEYFGFADWEELEAFVERNS